MDTPNENGLPTRQRRQPPRVSPLQYSIDPTARISISAMSEADQLKLIDDLMNADGFFGEVESVDDFFDRFEPDELYRFVRNHVPELLERLEGGHHGF